jgi:hypothetical protein
MHVRQRVNYINSSLSTRISDINFVKTKYYLDFTEEKSKSISRKHNNPLVIVPTNYSPSKKILKMINVDDDGCLTKHNVMSKPLNNMKCF